MNETIVETKQSPDVSKILAESKRLRISPLIYVVVNCAPEVLVGFLAAGIAKEEKFEWQRALHLAAVHGKADWVKVLMTQEATKGARFCGGKTPLHGATENGHEACMKLFLENGEDKEVKDSDGRTRLH